MSKDTIEQLEALQVDRDYIEVLELATPEYVRNYIKRLIKQS